MSSEKKNKIWGYEVRAYPHPGSNNCTIQALYRAREVPRGSYNNERAL